MRKSTLFSVFVALVYLALASCTLSLAACRTMGALGEDVGSALPATQGDLMDLRDHVDASDASIRSDVSAASTAGAAAYEAALAGGKSEADAFRAAVAAELAAGKASADAAAAEAARLREAAKDVGGLGVPEVGGIGGALLLVAGLLVRFVRRKIREYDEAPFAPEDAASLDAARANGPVKS